MAKSKWVRSPTRDLVVSVSNWSKLNDLKEPAEPFDGVISRLLNEIGKNSA